MAIDTSAWNEIQLDPVSPPPEDFEGIGVEEGVALIRNWFFENFEDPAQNTPYESREGGYIYIWGGPYEAYDIIRDVFAGVAPDEIIDAAIEAIEHEGCGWVPNQGRVQPPDDEWLDHVIQNDPYRIFLDSYSQTDGLLASHGGEEGNHLINRMVFAQQVSALEAYLADTLLKAVTNRRVAMERLATGDRKLNAEKFTLADLVKNPNILAEKVTSYLRSILYHDLKKVNFLYQTALDIRILRENDDNVKLLTAITYRHDCVHRNGMDKDGNRLEVFTKAYVRESADLMRSLVDRIEREIHGGLPF